MGFSVRAILDPRGTHGIDVVTDRAGRRALWIELCIVGSKTCALRLPSALARYIATSALRKTSSTAVPGRPAATPA